MWSPRLDLNQRPTAYKTVALYLAELLGNVGSAPWTRTTISRFKVSHPAIGRAPKKKLGGCVAHPPGAESLFDVNQTIQQSVETTYNRQVAYVFSNLLQGLEFFETQRNGVAFHHFCGVQK